MNRHEQPAKPISFSPAMVEAINKGRKNQTRRIISPQSMVNDSGGLVWGNAPKAKTKEIIKGLPEYFGLKEYCQYGKPGDLLWVREEHLITREEGGYWRCEFKDGTITWHHTRDLPAETVDRLRARKSLGKWQRARFLPRYFARTYLKVTDIRVERLQDICEEDAKAEGFACISKDDGRTWKYGIPDHDGFPGDGHGTGWPWAKWEVDPRTAFRTLWESINGPRSWEAPQWVWVVKFERVNQ
ncbi:hypothetical protein [Chitinophaga sp. YIM B06452]|uniref:hypothetical protein n=1 Tax=Chitinophaga sp. YIM B06452 TaxID=3082158 RepID=UPI0031FEB2F8